MDLTAQNWIDVTLPLYAGMPHWPGDPDVEVEQFLQIAKGDVCNATRLACCAHIGTHMDAPLHYVQGGTDMAQMPLDIGMGPARIIEINDLESVTADECRLHSIQPGERILFRTGNTRLGHRTPFREDFIYVSADAARYLAECRVKLVGIDYLSVGGYTRDGVETHQALLNNNVWIVENLDLTHAPAGRYDMLCLPMKIEAADGAPCRVLLRPNRPPGQI